MTSVVFVYFIPVFAMFLSVSTILFARLHCLFYCMPYFLCCVALVLTRSSTLKNNKKVFSKWLDEHSFLFTYECLVCASSRTKKFFPSIHFCSHICDSSIISSKLATAEKKQRRIKIKGDHIFVFVLPKQLLVCEIVSMMLDMDYGHHAKIHKTQAFNENFFYRLWMLCSHSLLLQFVNRSALTVIMAFKWQINVCSAHWSARWPKLKRKGIERRRGVLNTKIGKSNAERHHKEFYFYIVLYFRKRYVLLGDGHSPSSEVPVVNS